MPYITKQNFKKSNQFQPILINHLGTETHKTNLLPNQSMQFQSKAIMLVPQSTEQPIRKNPRVLTKPHQLNRHVPPPTTEPILNRSKPDKKTKLATTHADPTQFTSAPTIAQEIPEDMETQSDKKRRREEECSNDSMNELATEHFLTAGPGSQACRDQ
jgi:hypothetical protein